MYAIKLQLHKYLVSDSSGRPLYWISHDAVHVEDGSHDFLKEYLSEARQVFEKECDVLLDTNRIFTPQDLNRLTVMLKLLIDARMTWQEETVAQAERFSRKTKA